MFPRKSRRGYVTHMYCHKHCNGITLQYATCTTYHIYKGKTDHVVMFYTTKEGRLRICIYLGLENYGSRNTVRPAALLILLIIRSLINNYSFIYSRVYSMYSIKRVSGRDKQREEIKRGFLRIFNFKDEVNGRGIRCADHATPIIRKRWHQLHRQAAIARSV
jgi:hypothetical protein